MRSNLGPVLPHTLAACRHMSFLSFCFCGFCIRFSLPELELFVCRIWNPKYQRLSHSSSTSA